MRGRSESILFVLAAALSISGFSTSEANGQTADSGNPNILVIIADDLGWSDVGYNGSEVQTPNIDLLARSGVRLDHYYATPTCTPTRVGLITGKYPSRYGVLGPDYGEVIPPGEPTLASILVTKGYETAIAGKWHMGSPPHTPTAYGFQSSYGYFDGQIDPYTHAYKTGRNSWHRNDKVFREEGHATDLITREAVRVIEEKREKPFFLYVAYSVPHYPLDEPVVWTSRYDHLNLHPSRKLFAASVTHMDDGIGKIIEALERTHQRENTLVLFISDNGGQESWQSKEEYHGSYADKPHSVLGNNYPLRGWKVDVYEGGIRVPAVISWPGVLSQRVNDDPIHVVDWLPTIRYLVKIEGDGKKLALDGQNVWPQLTGKTPADTARAMYWKTPNASAVRQGSWKLVVHEGTTEPELFNVEEDFRETKNLAAKERERTKALLELMEEFRKGDKPPKGSSTEK